MDSIDMNLGTLKINGDPSALYENLAKAQSEFLPVPEDSKGQVGNNRSFKYADFATIIKCIRPALTKYGIAFLQPLHTNGDRAVTTTILAGHGASVQASLEFEHNTNPQEFGRVHTYHRRYQLLGFFAIEGEDADDARAQIASRGNAQGFSEPAPKSEPRNAAPAKEPAKPAAAPPEKQAASVEKLDVRALNAILISNQKALGWSNDDVRAFYKEHVDPKGIAKVGDLTVEQRRALHAKMVEIKNVEPF